MSNGELDSAYVVLRDANSKLPRTFYRIKTLGTSPMETRSYLKKTSIFEAVHELTGSLAFEEIHGLTPPPPYAEACYLLVSPLWEILTHRNISVARLNAIIESLLRVYNGERFMAWQLGELERNKDSSGKILQESLGVTDDDLLEPFRNADDVDSLALLIALYKVALSEVELALALLLQEAILDVVTKFTRKWSFEPELEDLIMQLVMDRGLQNIWLTEEDWVKNTGTVLLTNSNKKVTDSQRKAEIASFIHWYIRRPVNLSLSDERVGLPLSQERYDQIVKDYFAYDPPMQS